MSQTSGEPIVSIALRGGRSLDIWAERVVAAGRTYRLRDLLGATVVADPAAPAGAAPLPAVALRGSDGSWTTYVPADPPDAQRALDTLYALRPNLRQQYALFPGGQPRVPQNETILAGIAHLSVFFAPLLVPLIIWLAAERTAPYASRQAKQAFFFHIGLIVLSILVIVPLFAGTLAALFGGAASGDARGLGLGFIAFAIGALLVAILGLVGLGFSIYGAIEGFLGRPFSYPFMRRV
jgi:uncharacterized Tic20 family protein